MNKAANSRFVVIGKDSYIKYNTAITKQAMIELCSPNILMLDACVGSR